jgi:hypothetical protein
VDENQESAASPLAGSLLGMLGRSLKGGSGGAKSGDVKGGDAKAGAGDISGTQGFEGEVKSASDVSGDKKKNSSKAETANDKNTGNHETQTATSEKDPKRISRNPAPNSKLEEVENPTNIIKNPNTNTNSTNDNPAAPKPLETFFDVLTASNERHAELKGMRDRVLQQFMCTRLEHLTVEPKTSTDDADAAELRFLK